MKRSDKSDETDRGFDNEKAEFFEALGHPTRIKILQILGQRPQSFSELKKQTGIDSSGNLTFHLGKLVNLIKTNSDGNYQLTDDGREAVRVIETSVQCELSKKLGDRSVSPKFNLGIIAISIVWAITMILVSVLVRGSVVLGNNLLEVEIGGFIACLLILTWLGRVR
jgi:DNA-binding transcriptional ArsR family regulator